MSLLLSVHVPRVEVTSHGGSRLIGAGFRDFPRQCIVDKLAKVAEVHTERRPTGAP